MTGKTKLKSALDQLTRSGALVKIVYLADAVSVTVKARDGQKHGFVASGKGRKKRRYRQKADGHKSEALRAASPALLVCDCARKSHATGSRRVIANSLRPIPLP